MYQLTDLKITLGWLGSFLVILSIVFNNVFIPRYQKFFMVSETKTTEKLFLTHFEALRKENGALREEFNQKIGIIVKSFDTSNY